MTAPFLPAGVAASAGEQVVSNPGRLRRRASAERNQQQRVLKDELQAISAEIAALERSLRSAPLRMRSQQKACNLPQQNENIQTELHQLMDRLQGLQTLAAEPADSVALVATQAPPQMTTRTHRPSTPSSSASRPQSAPYHAIIDAPDDASVVSWSADAFGRSRNPGWYHLNRKELYAQRARLKRAVPKGCFDSYGKYADEASRIQNTGRLAF